VADAAVYTGVMKHVGDALGDTIVQSRNNIVTIGIAPWGVVHKNDELVGQDVNILVSFLSGFVFLHHLMLKYGFTKYSIWFE